MRKLNRCSEYIRSAAITAAVITSSWSLTVAAKNNAALDPQEIDDIVIVSGSRTEEKLEDVAGAVSVVRAEDIDVQVSNSFSDLFRYDPSLSSTGKQGQAQTLNVRGIGGNRVIYIKDGRRLNDAYAGGGGFLVGRGYLDTSQLKQVEIAKAAASPLYGSDGLGGVIVISTPDPDDVLNGEDSAVSLFAGFDDAAHERKLGASAAKQFRESAALLQVTARKGNETQNYEETLPGYDYDSQSVLAKWAFDVAKKDKLVFSVDHFQQTNEQVITDTNQTRDDDKQTAMSIDYHATSKATMSDNQHWQLYISEYQQTSDQIAAGSGQAGPYVDYNDYRFEQTIIGARWQAQKALAASSVHHDLVYGFDIDHYDTKRPRFKTQIAADGDVLKENEPQQAFPGAETWLAGIFIQNNTQFRSVPFKLIAGARLDHYRMTPKDSALYDMSLLSDISETAISPKIAGIYTFNNGVRTYLQYAEGFKIPPHDQAYQNHGIEPFYAILPNPDLQPESSRSLEAGLKFSNDTWRWNIAAYYSRFDDFIENEIVNTSPTYIPGVERVEYQYTNKDQVTIKGVEASLIHWLTDYWRFDAAAAYVTGENDATNEPLVSLTPLSGNLSLGYFSDIWYLRGVLNATHAMTDVPFGSAEAGPSIETGGYATLDVLTGITLGRWQVNIAALNVTDKYYVPYQNVAGLAEGSPVQQYSQPGRSVALQAKLNF